MIEDIVQSILEGVPVGDSRARTDKPGEYRIGSVIPGCSIVCSKPGVKLVDFYRTVEFPLEKTT